MIENRMIRGEYYSPIAFGCRVCGHAIDESDLAEDETDLCADCAVEIAESVADVEEARKREIDRED